MPALTPAEIVAAIEDAFTQAGVAAVLTSRQREHPRKFYISGESPFSVWIYIWTLTHGGGRARAADEYRVQLTSVKPPLPQNPDGPTLLLGYEPNLKCFAGFDLRKHTNFSTQSPSIQININTLRDAERDGFAFARKGNNEIAVGLRPDNILAYALHSDQLHKYGADAKSAALLIKASRFEPIVDSDLTILTEERRRIVSQIARLARDSSFARKVTVAYDRRCCVTGIQLQLIDAAHIIPVGSSGSTDEVRNGLCLSPTYHRAFDRGLIYLSEDRKMLLNERKRKNLATLGLDGGIRDFEKYLGREIFLPPDRAQWPHIPFVRAANLLRIEQR